MIFVGDPEQSVDAAVLEAPGGFTWWYLDLLAQDGSGAVVIWSYGLPFLPGYTNAARRGEPQRPSGRPSLNIAIYDRGQLACYLLQELPPDQAEWQESADRWRFGGTTLRSWREGDRLKVQVDLDALVPACADRLTGCIELDGVARRPGTSLGSDGTPHIWTPLMGPAMGRMDVRVGSAFTLQKTGRAYHDRNSAAVPLDALGIRDWTWGRVPFPDHERIYYLLWPERTGDPVMAIGLTIDPAGETRLFPSLELKLDAPRRSVYGPAWWSRIEMSSDGAPWLTVQQKTLVENGPFYLRFITDAEDTRKQRARGWGEVVVPARIDLAHHRRFVRMRVHDLRGPNTWMLPWFSGPTRGRLGRFLGQIAASGIFSRAGRTR